MEKTFESFKKFISEKGKQANACTSEYNRVLESKDYADLLQVIKDNYNWCFNNSIFTKEELISLVPNDVLLDNGFYYDYSGELLNDKTAFVFDSTIQNVRDNATIQDVRGNATIQDVRGNATIQNVRGNATIQNVRGNATIQNVWDNATIQDVWDNATIQHVRDNATIQDVRGNATIQNVWDNATIQDVWGNATIQNVWDNGKYFKIRYGEKPKLFMKKNAFEIVEL